MPATIAPIDFDVFTALRGFLEALLASEVKVIKTQSNNVPMPKAPFIAMTPLFKRRLETNIDSFYDPFFEEPPVLVGFQYAEMPMEYTVQIDCCGDNSSDLANIISAVWRDDYSCEALQPMLQPLYASDPRQIPLSDSEQNYTQRWSLDLKMQYNPVVTLPMQFMDDAKPGLINVDVEFPPN